jgi:hypothetical protein
MNRLHMGMSILGMLCLGYVALVAITVPQMPDVVASHFGAGGEADGWMNRGSYAAFIVAFGLGIPAFVMGMSYAIRLLPDWMINLPNRDYWLAPERRAETFAYSTQSSVWMASMVVLLMAGLHCLTVQANSQAAAAARLPLVPTFALLGCFLAGTLVWCVCMLRRFRR